MLRFARAGRAHLSAAVMLLAAGRGDPLAGAARLADAVVRPRRALGEALAHVRTRARSAGRAHPVRARATMAGRASERQERERGNPEARIGESHRAVLPHGEYVSAAAPSRT